jgi:HK97 gp10 family phage protein
MASGGVEFKITDPLAPRKACAQNVAEAAQRVRAQAAANTPRDTGRMASSWSTRPGYSDPATTVVINTAPHARFVEYGTRHMRARAPLGRAMASGGRG